VVVYAVFIDRNQQYRVAPGDRVMLALQRSLEPGDEIAFDRVCAVGGDEPRLGTPFVDGARVTATVIGEVKGPKLTVQKFRRRKNYRRRTGFRARYTEVRIDAVNA
jgi:large subunit ribosomal protein L21